ncbi:MAG: DNA polymerase III subunit beta [Actinomycetia bacterium]|nr:DNA polymerase III subunit beta [Actinomycetes bacterium]
MKIRIERDAMAEAVAWAARSLPNRPSVPILGGLLIEAAGDGVTLSSFDYETSARVFVAATVFDEGKALVSGKLLAEIARNLPNEPVNIDTDETKAELTCGPARFTLQMLPVGDYPELPAMPSSTGTVPPELFAKAVGQVVVAAGRDELLAIYTGVRVEIEGDTLSLLATDRYRMALRELTWAPAEKNVQGAAIVPGRVLNEAARSMASGEEITISLAGSGIGDGLIGFAGEGAAGRRQLTTRLLDGEFPKFRHLLDVVANVSVRVKTDDLLAAVRRVALVAERNTPLRMLITDEQIALDAATGDQAQASEVLEAVVTNHAGGELGLEAAGFNPHYLADALGALDAPYVHFSFTGPGQPCLVQGVDDADGDPRMDYKHVIMLMRLPA